MTKKPATLLTLVIGFLAIATPIFFTLQQARKQGLEHETAHTLAYARDVLRRTDITSDQIIGGLTRLAKSLSPDPCSEASLTVMREVDLTSTYIQAMGYVSGDRLVCSSYGKHKEPVAVGPVGLILRNGATLRYDVKFPFAGDTPFLVIERYGYAAVVHKDLPIDATTVEDDVSLATFTTVNRRIVASRGIVRPQWIDAASDHYEATFIDGEYLVAVVRSQRYNTGAIAALPVKYLDKQIRQLTMLLAPIGLIAGIVLAFAALYLARLQLAMPAVIRAGLRRNEFFLVYQPVVDLATGAWVGAEALVRWRRAGGEMVRPDIFIPAAEDIGIMEKITERVIEIIARDAPDLFKQHPDFHLAVNLSSVDLKSQRTRELLQRLVRDVKAGPQNFIVEATERGFMHADAARQVISQLRADGIRVAIDDFGTGYSGLSYLETFELDFLKIDKSFVDTVGTEAATSHVIPHIIEMAKALKLKIIAEGVETEAQATFLRERGVQYAQGWLYGKPMPPADLMKELSLQADKEILRMRRSAAAIMKAAAMSIGVALMVVSSDAAHSQVSTSPRAAKSPSPMQAYPTKPVRLILGPPAGGPTDGVARVLASRLSEIWGQQLVIENRPGAGNTIATALAARAMPDGYTLLLCPISDAVAPALHKKLPYDFLRDFAAIAHIGTTPNVLVVHPGLPVKSVSEFIAHAKANPGKIDYAATGMGQSGHLSMELLKSMTGIDVVFIQYKTVGVAVTDLLAGRVSAQITNLPAQLEHIKAGRVRALGVTSVKRNPRLPEVPTIAESGVPGFEVKVWYGMCAPAAVPKPILTKVEADVLKVLDEAETRQRLGQQGVDAEPLGAAAFASFIKSETAKWAKVVTNAGIKPQ